MWSEMGGYWGIGRNLSGQPLFSARNGITWQPGEVLLHPKGGAAPSGLVVGWTAPSNMVVDVRYAFGPAAEQGNSIGYQITKRSGGVDTDVVDLDNIGANDSWRTEDDLAKKGKSETPKSVRATKAGIPPEAKKRKPASRKPAAKAQGRLPSTSDTFPIVGMGASAGGLEAFTSFFNNMPADSHMAVVLVVHLDPGHTSMMPELLKRHTAMNVIEAQDGMTVEPNRVYVIPPNKDMSIFGRVLQIGEPAKVRGLRMPIDFLFRSLAEDQGEKAISVILSGTGSDGRMLKKAVQQGRSERRGEAYAQGTSSL